MVVASLGHELWSAFQGHGLIRRWWLAEVAGSVRWPGRRVLARVSEAKRIPPSVVVLELAVRPVGVLPERTVGRVDETMRFDLSPVGYWSGSALPTPMMDRSSAMLMRRCRSAGTTEERFDGIALLLAFRWNEWSPWRVGDLRSCRVQAVAAWLRGPAGEVKSERGDAFVGGGVHGYGPAGLGRSLDPA